MIGEHSVVCVPLVFLLCCCFCYVRQDFMTSNLWWYSELRESFNFLLVCEDGSLLRVYCV